MNEFKMYKKKGILFSEIFIAIGLVAAVGGYIRVSERDYVWYCYRIFTDGNRHVHNL